MKTGIYIHYPFCISKCPYCDFNSVVAKDINEDAVLSAMIRDINYYHSMTGNLEIDTIYFGGGTPSLMQPKTIKAILNKINELFIVKENAEITLEANPITAEIEKFQQFKNAGINRLSIGVQSFSDKGLKTLGRVHNAQQAKKALTMAKTIFDRVSFDLIYGWKSQTLADWEQELTTALKYEEGHLSIYQLTIYKETPLASSGAKEISAEQSIQFSKKTKKVLANAGINQYEISNYAKEGQESQHNLIYWHYDDYIGIGAGASGRITLNNKKIAFKNEDNINEWLNSNNPEKDTLTNEDMLEEYVLMGLRLNEGIDISDLKLKTGENLEKLFTNAENLSDFIIINKNYIKATEQGLNCLNSVLGKLL